MKFFRVIPALILLAGCLAVAVAMDVRAAGLGNFDTVVVDAGHGGHDRGGIPGQRLSEKALALDIALRLEGSLKRRGFRTVMTRRTDVFIPLAGRVAVANARPRSIFVSIHCNSSTNPEAHGIETYYYGPKSFPLAVEIHRRALPLATMDRRIRQRGFYVLRKTRVPAVLFECGFLTCHTDATLIVQSRYRQRLADEIARAIALTRSKY